MSRIEDDIDKLVSPPILAMGLELWGVDYRPGNGNALLRLYIDAEGRAVNLDDCEAVSREVSALLDVHDPIDGQYTLEVSSPGLDRPLFRLAHFARFVGEVAKLELEFPQEGRRRFQGEILGVADDAVSIEQDGQAVRLAIGSIRRARLVPGFETPARPGRAPARHAGRKKQGG